MKKSESVQLTHPEAPGSVVEAVPETVEMYRSQGWVPKPEDPK